MTLKKAHPEAYRAAAHLIDWGIPVFIAKRARSFPHGGSGDTGYEFPQRWQETSADPAVLDRWKPGDALCAVMGKVVDGIDVDPRSGPDGMPQDVMPHSYGRQRTPSGGTHDLIAALGERSWNGMFPGVDYKAGQGARGRGFLFIAPTVRMSKVDGELREYTWEVEPSIDEDIAVDQSGEPLRERIAAHRRGSSLTSYDSKEFGELTQRQQQQARDHVDDVLTEWSWILGDAAGWDDGVRDAKGRGWEALVRDFAWTVALLAAAPWTPLDMDAAEDAYLSRVPKVMLDDPKCSGKWHSGLLSKAEAEPVSLPPWWSNELFDATPELRHIRDAAQSRLAPPSGVLALVLGRVLAEVPPSVMLPPVIASPASLNLGIAVVAGSGGGKSSAINISQELMGLVGMEQDRIEHGFGSGEGLVDLFLQPEMAVDDHGKLRPTGENVLADDPRAIVVCDEVEILDAVGGRQGSSLFPMMRDTLTGEGLNMSNARAGGRSRNVPKRSYRAIVVMGVQPGRSDILLSEQQVSVGTPQRFLWSRATDPDRPEKRPEWPGPLNWTPPAKWPDMIEYPDHITAEVIQAREDFLDGKVAETDGHAMLTRLKVATALAVLHGETRLSDQWWVLSKLLMSQSREIQEECRRHLQIAADRRAVAAAKRQAVASVEAGDAAGEVRLKKAASALLRKMERNPKATWSAVKPAFRLRDGLDTIEIIETAVTMSEGALSYTQPSDNRFELTLNGEMK